MSIHKLLTLSFFGFFVAGCAFGMILGHMLTEFGIWVGPP